MDLSELKIGQIATITHLYDVQPIMRKKLLNMGFLPQAQVELVRVAPMGDPIVIRCANSAIALRKNLVKQIKVEPRL